MQLEKRIQALPKELQDMILAFTIAVPTGETIDVNEDYQPLIGLQIDRKSRKRNLQKFLGTNTFLCHKANKDDFYRWLKQLPPEQISLLANIQIRMTHPPAYYRPCDAKEYLLMLHRVVIKEYGINFKPGVLKLNARHIQETGQEEIEWISRAQLESLP